MPTHNVSFSICLDFELDYECVAPDVIEPGDLRVGVIDNEGRTAPKWLLDRIRDHLLDEDYERTRDYVHRDMQARVAS